jgi:hypothetical protein
VHVDLESLRSNIAANDEHYRMLNAVFHVSQQNALHVTYEELFSADERRRMLKFLGVSEQLGLLRVESIKQNSTDLRQLVDNFDELAEALNGSELEAELHDRGL